MIHLPEIDDESRDERVAACALKHRLHPISRSDSPAVTITSVLARAVNRYPLESLNY